MAERQLHIAWLGPAPGEDGGAPGVASDLLEGLAALGHRIDCFFPAAGLELPERVLAQPNIVVNWGTARWSWDRWYSRNRVMALLSGMLVRSLSSLRLRGDIVRRHRQDPYDAIVQFSTIESLSVPARLIRAVPFVLAPTTYAAGELRSLLAERGLSVRCGGWPRYLAVCALLLLRTLVQRRAIRRARLLVCISGVFRDHLVRDYGVPAGTTVVVPNPVRLERFAASERVPADPATVLVLGRVAARKGVQDVVAAAQELDRRGARVRFRVVGGPSLWSDYTKLLDDLPASAEYAGGVAPAAVPDELAQSDVLVQASRYEPFALTVAEALAAGVPVVATSEVGAIEEIDRTVAAEVAPGDVEGLAAAILDVLARLRDEPRALRARARAEAERLFAPALVCEQFAAALTGLVGD